VHYIQFFCFRMTEMVHQHILESGIFEVWNDPEETE
jgi:hypothetical protein